MVRNCVVLAAAAAALFVAGSAAQAAPVYAPVGPQKNVLFSTVTGGGWSQCFSEPYGTTGTTVASAVAGCSGDLLMLAGAQNDAREIQLLAWALKTDVLTQTAANATHTSNGTNWYLNNSSMGFAPVGFAISQNSCDTNSAPGFGSVGDDGTERLCWHTGGNAGSEVLNGGWRVGNNTFLNSEPSGFTRYMFTARSQPVPEPASIALLGLGFAVTAGAAARRRRSNR